MARSPLRAVHLWPLRAPADKSQGGRMFTALILVAWAAAVPAAAQNTGTVSGTIVDATGQLVPGATITLVSETTANSRTTTSDTKGEFAFRAVEPGSYTLKFELAGFRTLERKN